MKKVICISFVLLLLSGCAAFTEQEKRAEPWQAAYFGLLKGLAYPIIPEHNDGKIMLLPDHAFADYNQDGILELIINPGPHNFDDEIRMDIYTYADGELRYFSQGNYFEPLPDGYRNKQTGELKWICPSSDMPEYMHGPEEMIFDFDTYQITFIEIPYGWEAAYELVLPHDADRQYYFPIDRDEELWQHIFDARGQTQ